MTLRYLTTAQAAEIVGVGTTTMRALIEDGGIRWTDIGRNGRPRIRIAEDDLRDWMTTRATDRPARAAS